jgi:hypothetical protein
MRQAFQKVLSPNDIGTTKSHQAGMLVPKADAEFRYFLGDLDPAEKNPRRRLLCLDEYDHQHVLNFIYYNNKLHDEEGTRDEYRLTGLTAYMRQSNARTGDEIEISKDLYEDFYRITLIRKERAAELPSKVVLRGWRRIH